MFADSEPIPLYLGIPLALFLLVAVVFMGAMAYAIWKDSH